MTTYAFTGGDLIDDPGDLNYSGNYSPEGVPGSSDSVVINYGEIYNGVLVTLTGSLTANSISSTAADFGLDATIGVVGDVDLGEDLSASGNGEGCSIGMFGGSLSWGGTLNVDYNAAFGLYSAGESVTLQGNNFVIDGGYVGVGVNGTDGNGVVVDVNNFDVEAGGFAVDNAGQANVTYSLNVAAGAGVIVGGGTLLVGYVGLAGTSNVGNVTVGGALEVTGGSDSDVSDPGTFGYLGNMDVEGGLSVSGGSTVGGIGQLTIGTQADASATVAVSGAGSALDVSYPEDNITASIYGLTVGGVAPAALTISDGAFVVVYEGQLTLDGNVTVNTDGTVSAEGGIDFSDGGSLEVGSVDGLSPVSGVTTENLQIDPGQSLTGHGLIDSDVTGQVSVGNSATVPSYSLTVENNGTIEASGGLMVIHGNVVNDGTITVSTGKLSIVGGLSGSGTESITGGNFTLDAAATTGANRVDITAGGGTVNLTGGTGNDIFQLPASAFSADDTVAGGAGTDTLMFTTAGTIAASAFIHVTGIDAIDLANGTNSLTLSNNLVGSSDHNKVSIAGGTGSDTISSAAGLGEVVVNGSKTSRLVYTGGAGQDDATGGSGNDTFRFQIANLTLADVVHGGAGTDTLIFTTAGTIAASAFTHVTGIDAIDLANGTNSLTLSNGVVANSDNKKVTIGGLTGSDTINALAVALGSEVVVNGGKTSRLVYTGGAGQDDVTGGAGNDRFRFQVTNLTSTDTVHSGAGTDTLLFTNAGTIAASAFTHVTGIDAIDLANGTNSLTLSNAVVASSDGKKITIAGGTGTDTINALAVALGNEVVVSGGQTSQLVYTGGAGQDDVTGGSGNDRFRFQVANLTSTDTVHGGAGTDTLLFINAGTVAASAFTHVTGIDAIDLANGTNSLTVANVLVANSDNKQITIDGGTGSDTINASAVKAAGTIVFNGRGGADAITGGQGDNVYDFNKIAGQTLSIGNAFGGGTAAHGQLDFGAGISDEKLWFERSGNNLVADVIGTSEQVTIKGWFGTNKSAQLSEIEAGGLKLDSQIQQLVTAMATYAADNPGFNPSAVGATMPTDTTLQNALASAWHA